jgi:hydroxymethylglutaryl-CoA reductase (NADPH)
MLFGKLIPDQIIANLYTRGSLQKTADGLSFSLKNRLMKARLLKVISISLDEEPLPADQVTILQPGGTPINANAVSSQQPLDFPLGNTLAIHIKHDISVGSNYRFHLLLLTEPFGKIRLNFEDVVSEQKAPDRASGIPRSETDDYTKEIIRERLHFAEKYSGTRFPAISQHHLNPQEVRGNCENFIGAVQVPLGLAGPVRVCGEYADGEFLVPMATTEGTLLASYNRGIKLVNQCGGVKTTVTRDAMQRAPVFVFDDARQARDFAAWVDEHLGHIQQIAAEGSRYARLQHIDNYLSNAFAFLRFNFQTGDAAGQNMVTKATYESCLWIQEHCPIKPRHFYLESNMATDKKPSFINSLQGRGKSVTAEVLLKKEVLEREMRVSGEQLNAHQGVAGIGALLSGVNNNGLHSVNAITAMFIATGQDVATVAESSACRTHIELLSNGDLNASLSLPSLVVGSFGGGTGLPMQRECLEMMGCYGEGKARKLAEIIAAVVIAGEISLAAAISSADWVSSHEAMGRNK